MGTLVLTDRFGTTGKPADPVSPRRQLICLLFEPAPVTDHLQAIIAVLSLVNPFMCAAIFVQIEAGKSPGAQLASATKVASAVFVILTVAALVGVKVLHLFGVSLDAFMAPAAACSPGWDSPCCAASRRGHPPPRPMLVRR